MITCSKIYSDIPFAHRQPNHDGHCRFIHGHNWEITLTFTADQLDVNNFVIDFGKLKYLKKWIDDHLDHACVLNNNDPILQQVQDAPFFKLLLVEDSSCEGLAQFLFNEFQKLVRENEHGRVQILKIMLKEDQKNFTEYQA